MDSLTARVIAFALPALGLFVSSENTFLTAAGPNAPSISVVKDDGGSPSVARFAAEEQGTVAPVDRENQIQIRKSEWMKEVRSSVSFIHRLPAIDTEVPAVVLPRPQESDPPSCTLGVDGQLQCINPTLDAAAAPPVFESDAKSKSIASSPAESVKDYFYREYLSPQISAQSGAEEATSRETAAAETATAATEQAAQEQIVPMSDWNPDGLVQVEPADPVQVELDSAVPPRVAFESEVVEPGSAIEGIEVESTPAISFSDQGQVASFPLPLPQETDTDDSLPGPPPQSVDTNQLAAGATSSTSYDAKSDIAVPQPTPPISETQSTTQDWSPVDMRTVDVDVNRMAETQPVASQATSQDKLQAQRAVQLGFELVQRRAHYSARARFIQALRVVARSLDDQTHSTQHSNALRNALAAYEEAVEFYPTAARPGEDIRVGLVIGGHNTTVLENADTATLTPRQCIREYMAYAEQEFVVALGSEQFASQALYGLGRLEAAQETSSTTSPQVRANRSLMLYQTALLVDQRNFAAANELGVLLAKFGKYGNAVNALRHCVKHSPEPTAWQNLANIYRRMGNLPEAQMAEAEAHRALARNPGTPFVAAQPRVEWVEPNAFAAMNAESNLQIARRQPQEPAVALPPSLETRATTQTASRKKFWPFGRR